MARCTQLGVMHLRVGKHPRKHILDAVCALHSIRVWFHASQCNERHFSLKKYSGINVFRKSTFLAGIVGIDLIWTASILKKTWMKERDSIYCILSQEGAG